MLNESKTHGPLYGRRIALPETREAARLALMFRQQGAETVSCPLVSIVDAADPTPLQAWLRRFVDTPFDDLILLTGEGLRRLCAVAARSGLEQAFVGALAKPRKITRGPKPARALRELGLTPDLPAEEPTTEGIIKLLEQNDLHDRRVGIQLYPGASNRLVDFLASAGATPDPVVPYAYASQAEDERVAALIDEMASERIDVIAFYQRSADQAAIRRRPRFGAGRQIARRSAKDDRRRDRPGRVGGARTAWCHGNGHAKRHILYEANGVRDHRGHIALTEAVASTRQSVHRGGSGWFKRRAVCAEHNGPDIFVDRGCQRCVDRAGCGYATAISTRSGRQKDNRFFFGDGLPTPRQVLQMRSPQVGRCLAIDQPYHTPTVSRETNAALRGLSR
jgi:uroporphyrinogen-III synthase